MMEVFPMILLRVGGLPLDAWRMPDPGNFQVAPGVIIPEKLENELNLAFDRLLGELPENALRTQVYNARKSFFRYKKLPGEKFRQLLATAQTPAADVCLTILKQYLLLQEERKRSEDRFDRRLIAEYEQLQELAAGEWMQRALLCTSHDLLDNLAAFIEKKPELFDKRDRRIARTLHHYLARAVFKTSPLGRFTRVCLFDLEHEQDEVAPWEKVSWTPNVALLPALYDLLLRHPECYETLEVELNPCIDATNRNDWTWIYFDGEQEAVQHLQGQPLLNLLVEHMAARNRRQTWKGLINILHQNVDAPAEQLQAWLLELIDTGFLEWRLPESGLSASWVSGLTQFLGFVQSSRLATDMAYLLQNIRTAAKTIPYQPVPSARQSIEEIRLQIDAFFRNKGAVPPPIPAAQLFYEDVAAPVRAGFRKNDLDPLLDDLRVLWNERKLSEAAGMKARLTVFAQKIMEPGAEIDFLEFYRRFEASPIGEIMPATEPRFQGKAGALLQVYQENGLKAVVHALYPGGGKLFARWSHLFRDTFRNGLENWIPDEVIVFPWQGWSNANFQPFRSKKALHVPGGRTGRSQDDTLLLAHISVLNTPTGPVLIDKHARTRIHFTDLGLETPESKPPYARCLWYLGVPNISVSLLAHLVPDWTTVTPGVAVRERSSYGSLVLNRKAWLLERPADMLPDMSFLSAFDRHRKILDFLAEIGVPQMFFAKTSGKRDKPEFFDVNSIISMQLFEKRLNVTSDSLYIEEMLPLPEQWVSGENSNLVSEIAVEFAL